MADAPQIGTMSPEDPSRAAPLAVADLSSAGNASAAATRPLTSADLASVIALDAGQIGLLDDVELDVKIELGRTSMYVEDVLRLGVGSVVELDKLAGDPVDVYINERLVARGEVLVLNENLCVRVNDIINPVPEFDAWR